MTTLDIVPLSVLDLAPVPTGSSVGDALRSTIALAQRVEQAEWWQMHRPTGAPRAFATTGREGARVAAQS